MTLEVAQFALTLFLYVAGAIWAISAWRARTDQTSGQLPDIERRLELLETRYADIATSAQTLQDVRVRIEQVAVRSHEAINQIAALPKNLGSEFLRREVGEMAMRDSNADRERIHRDMDEVRKNLESLRRYVSNLEARKTREHE